MGLLILGGCLLVVFLFLKWRRRRRLSLRRESLTLETTLAEMSGSPVWRGQRWPESTDDRY